MSEQDEAVRAAFQRGMEAMRDALMPERNTALRDLAATRALLAEAEKALTEQKEWHEAERKALGKQPQTGDLPWRRNQHLEQIDVIDAVLALIKSATSADGGEAR